MSQGPVGALQDYLHAKPIPVGVSNRHIHLTLEHVEALFGPGARLSRLRALTQKGQFASNETLSVATGAGVIGRVRVLGPERSQSQVELTGTDARRLKLHPPVRDSGSLDGSAGCTLIGPVGSVQLDSGVIVASRHVHMSPRDADEYGVAAGDQVSMFFDSDRGAVFKDVLIRVHATYVLDFHLDTDEANAVLAKTGDPAYLLDTGKIGMDLQVRMARPSGGRRLMTERDLRSIVAKDARVRIPAGVLLTPSARDLARKLKIV